MQITQYIDRTPQNFERLTVTNAVVVRLNQTNREAANAIFVTVEDNTIWYRIEGGSPDDGDEGHPVPNGGNLYLVDKKSIRELRMIGSSGTADVKVTYYI